MANERERWHQLSMSFYYKQPVDSVPEKWKISIRFFFRLHRRKKFYFVGLTNQGDKIFFSLFLHVFSVLSVDGDPRNVLMRWFQIIGLNSILMLQ